MAEEESGTPTPVSSEQTMGRRSFLKRALGALGLAGAATIATTKTAGETSISPQAAAPKIPVGNYPTDIPQPVATEARSTPIPTPTPAESASPTMAATPTPEIKTTLTPGSPEQPTPTSTPEQPIPTSTPTAVLLPKL